MRSGCSNLPALTLTEPLRQPEGRGQLCRQVGFPDFQIDTSQLDWLGPLRNISSQPDWVTPPMLSCRPKMAPPTSLTFRLRGCDAGTDRKAVQDVLVQAFDDISANDVHIRSLATTLMPWEDPPTKTATLNFTKLPSAIERCLSDGEWTVEDAASNNSLILDTHFLGLTPLNDVRPERHDYEYVLRYLQGDVIDKE